MKNRILKFANIADLAKGNTIALGVFEMSPVDSRQSSDIPVERDASGVPVAWRIFKLGENSISQGSEIFALEFTPEMFDQIITYFAEKGAKIPLDSKHFLYYLAEKMGVDESAVLKFLPDGRGTFGFASLEKRADGLWVTNAEYVPLARQLMAEQIWRYFSPVVRGLVDGRLRVTSVAFVNEPALNNLDAIAASSEFLPGRIPLSMDEIQGNLDALAASANIEKNNQKKEKEVMNKLLIAVAGLLAMDSISLGADGDASSDVIEKLKQHKARFDGLLDGEKKSDDFRKSLCDKLALGADAAPDVVVGKVIALAADAGQATQLKARVDAMELSAEKREHAALIEQGQKKGKLDNADLLAHAKSLDSIALGALLKVLKPGSAVPLDNLSREQLTDPDSIALSAADREMCSLTGTDEVKFLETKKQQAKEKQGK